jgi:gliding motility-associated-like protein
MQIFTEQNHHHKRMILLFFAVLFAMYGQAQVPTFQDCLGAIPICDVIHYQTNSYSGSGNYPNEIPKFGGCPGDCIVTGERNDEWYVLTTQTSGFLGFEIIPDLLSEDFDWVVFNMTNARCEDIFTQSSDLQVSCNYSLNDSLTGPNGRGLEKCQDASGSPYNALIPVLAGEIYVININKFVYTEHGYTLDFSSSTASISDNTAPFIDEVETTHIQCGDNELNISFGEHVVCNSVQPSAFKVIGPDGTFDVISVYGLACDLGGQIEKDFTLKMADEFVSSGEYFLRIVFQSGIIDACGNMAEFLDFPFTLDLNTPEIHDQEAIVKQASCGEDNGSISGISVFASGDLTYVWCNADGFVVGNQLDVFGLSGGDYELTVYNDQSCKSTSGPYHVQGKDLPQVDYSNLQLNNNFCNNPSGSITGLQVSGSPPFLYSWYDGDGVLRGSDLDLTDLSSGSYTLFIQDFNFCELEVGPYIVEDYPAPIIVEDNMIISNASCNENNGSIFGIYFLNPGAFEYEWTNEDGLVLSDTLDLINVPAGQYFLKVDAGGNCQSYGGPYQVLGASGPDVDTLGYQVTPARCLQNNGSITNIVFANSSSYNIEWRNDQSNVVGVSTDLTNVGPGKYFLYVTDNNNCEYQSGPYVVDNQGGLLVTSVDNKNPECRNENGEININVNPSQNVQYSIDDGANWIFDQNFDALDDGDYYVLIKDSIGCITDYENNPVQLKNIGEPVNASIAANSPICSGETIQFEMSNSGGFYTWTGPKGFFSQDKEPNVLDAQIENSGLYSVEVLDPSGNCMKVLDLNIMVEQSFSIQLDITSSKTQISSGEEITFTAIPLFPGTNPVYEWRVADEIMQTSNDAIFVSSDITSNQTVSCRMFVDELCANPNPASSNVLNMQVIDFNLFFPNSFKPSSQNGNNVFKAVTSVQDVSEFKLYVFANNGKCVFESKNLNHGWDGNIDGQLAPMGVYVWLVQYKLSDDLFPNGHVFDQKGIVSLIR